MVTFIVNIDGSRTQHDTFESAAMHWDRETHLDPPASGGIEIQVFRSDGVMIRDGWLVHVHRGGNVYVNPQALAYAH